MTEGPDGRPVETTVVEELRALRQDLVDAEGLRAEREHLVARLAASEIVEAELARRHVQDAARRAELQQLRRRLERTEQLLTEARGTVSRVQERGARLERRLEVSDRRLRDVEGSTSLRVGRAVMRLARLGRAGGATPSPPPRSTSAVDGAADERASAAAAAVGAASEGRRAHVASPPPGPVAVRDGTYTPVVMVVLLDVRSDDLPAALDLLDELPPTHRPLLVTDTDRFELLRARDLVFEYLPPREDLQRAFASAADEVRRERLTQLRELHRPVEVHRVVSGTSGAPKLELVTNVPPTTP